MAENWYPIVNKETCIECGKCIAFCKHGVYDKSTSSKPVVINPDGCIDHCHGCGEICPTGSITYAGEDTGWAPPNAKADQGNTRVCGDNKQYVLPENNKKYLKGGESIMETTKKQNSSCCGTSTSASSCCDTSASASSCCDTSASTSSCCDTSASTSSCCDTSASTSSCCDASTSSCCDTDASVSSCCDTDASTSSCCDTDASVSSCCGTSVSTSSCCDSSDTSCGCSSEPQVKKPVQKKELAIDFLYLDLNTCERCIATGDTLDEALTALAPMFETMNYAVSVKKVNINTKELAEQYRFISSPTIRVNGVDICTELKESNCGDCSDLSGTSTDCRVFVFEGEDYEQPPAAMIIDGIQRVLYGGQTQTEQKPYIMPENLVKFFAGINNSDDNTCGCGCGCD